MSDALKDTEVRFGELLRECARTMESLADHVENQGFEYQYVMRAFLKAHEQMGAVRDLGMLIIQFQQNRSGNEGFDRDSDPSSLFS